MSSTESVAANIAAWSRRNAEYTDPSARAWAPVEFRWGKAGVPEAELDVLGDVYNDVPVDWARRWPEEEIWVARKP
jgi:hypothetical protein